MRKGRRQDQSTPSNAGSFLCILATRQCTGTNGSGRSPQFTSHSYLLGALTPSPATPPTRIDVLDDIIRIAKNAVDRLSAKLQNYKGINQEVDVEEEFRLLTLQVIGEAVLSMSPEECDQVGTSARRDGQGKGRLVAQDLRFRSMDEAVLSMSPEECDQMGRI